MEQAFYEFVKEQFQFVKKQIYEVVDSAYVEKGNLFHYEKIRPRWELYVKIKNHTSALYRVQEYIMW